MSGLTVEGFEPQNIIEIHQGNKTLVTIGKDGTVTIHEPGADKEAAKMFYESLQIEGKTLHQKIATLTALVEEMGEALSIYCKRDNWRWCGEHFYGDKKVILKRQKQSKSSNGWEFGEEALTKYRAWTEKR